MKLWNKKDNICKENSGVSVNTFHKPRVLGDLYF